MLNRYKRFQHEQKVLNTFESELLLLLLFSKHTIKYSFSRMTYCQSNHKQGKEKRKNAFWFYVRCTRSWISAFDTHLTFVLSICRGTKGYNTCWIISKSWLKIIFFIDFYWWNQLEVNNLSSWMFESVDRHEENIFTHKNLF